MTKNQFKTYLTDLINEKGSNVENEIESLNNLGHFGLTWNDLIEFMGEMPEYFNQIRTTLVKIDFANGDVFHYLDFLAKGMIESLGY